MHRINMARALTESSGHWHTRCLDHNDEVRLFIATAMWNVRIVFGCQACTGTTGLWPGCWQRSTLGRARSRLRTSEVGRHCTPEPGTPSLVVVATARGLVCAVGVTHSWGACLCVRSQMRLAPGQHLPRVTFCCVGLWNPQGTGRGAQGGSFFQMLHKLLCFMKFEARKKLLGAWPPPLHTGSC